MLQGHAKGRGHTEALAALAGRLGVKQDSDKNGVASGISDEIPSLDKWLDACDAVTVHDSFGDYQHNVSLPQVG